MAKRRTGSNYTKTITFATTELQKDEIFRLAKMSGKSVSAFVRDMVLYYINKNKEILD